MIKVILTIFIIFINCTLFAQEDVTFQYADSVTFAAWQKQDWNRIIDIGNKALNNNIDYYYLRMRLGIAYYEQMHYNEAIQQFDKALEFNSADETAMELKYYSLLNSAKTRDAGYYAKTLPKNLLNKLKPLIPKYLDKISIETGLNILQGFDSLKYKIVPPDQKNYRLEKDVTGNFIFGDIAFNHEINKKFSLFHSFNIVQTKGFQQLYYNHNVSNQSAYTLNQLQYYFAPTFFWKKNNSITLFSNILYINSNKFKYTYQSIEPIPMPPPMYPPPVVYIYKIEPHNLILWQYVIGFNYLKNYKNDLIDITATYSNLNDFKQIELSTGYGFYANKQKTIFSKTNITLFSQKPDMKLIINQLIKIKLIKQIWVDVFGSYGSLRNYNENNGFTILNTNDETLYRFGVKLSLPILRKLNFYVSYSYSAKNLPLNYIYFTGIKQNKETFQSSVQNNYYKQHLIYGGLIWKF